MKRQFIKPNRNFHIAYWTANIQNLDGCCQHQTSCWWAEIAASTSTMISQIARCTLNCSERWGVYIIVTAGVPMPKQDTILVWNPYNRSTMRTAISNDKLIIIHDSCRAQQYMSAFFNRLLRSSCCWHRLHQSSFGWTVGWAKNLCIDTEGCQITLFNSLYAV